MSLFEGTPLTATSYTTSTSETPKWMQDAIYSQIKAAQNIANVPYQPYSLPTTANLSPLQQQAYANVVANQGAWDPAMKKAQYGMEEFTRKGTADQLSQAQGQYLRPELVSTNLNKGQGYWDRSGQMDIVGAAQPYLNRAGQTTAESLAERALTAASPYLQESAKKSVTDIGAYMSPYQSGVLDVIAKRGARNLSENLLPAVSDAFIQAGQFGSGRMGEFGSRALRDTQEAILQQQAQAAEQGYGQALSASQADLARQAQLAGTVGSISGADLSRLLQGGSQYGNLASTAGNLTQAQMSQLANLGQMQTQAGQTQQQFGINAAQAEQAARAQDYQRQIGALQGMAQLASQEQQMRASDVGALETAGLAQQTQAQRQLDAARSQFEAERMYPRQQMDWLSTQIRGLAPITPTTQTQGTTSTGLNYSPSPLSQLASGYMMYKGAQQLG